jgi:adenylate cyclase
VNRPRFERLLHRLRQASGLVLAAFVAGHLLNHAAGIVSLQAMEAGRVAFAAVWGGPIGQIALYGGLSAHLAVALIALYRRRTLRMRGWEWAQLLLGLAVPVLLIEHAVATGLGGEAFGLEPDYRFLQYVYWVAEPEVGAIQAALLTVAWTHGCIGLHYWLRTSPGYRRALPWAFGAALLLPALSLAGFVASGIRAAELARDPAWVEAAFAAARFDPALGPFVGFWTNTGLLAYGGLVGGTLALRAAVRHARAPRRKATLTYPGGRRVPVDPGATVLETSRTHGIPHASVCGGRGRCSTCRVRLGAGAEALPPPGPAERRVLERIAAPPNVRLACQIRPEAGLEVAPLLPPQAGPRDGVRRPDYSHGQEREVAILFADLRGFTRLADGKLPYDVVFLLNRYFQAMGEAVERAGGRVDKFLGDGVMALFGIARPPADAARQALAAARAMAAALEEINAAMAGDLPEPLRMGIGIHLGPAIVGEMGHGETRSITAVGDAVNTASRLEGLAKELGVQLVVSDDLAARAGVDLAGFESREMPVRGKRDAILIRAVPAARDLPEPER